MIQESNDGENKEEIKTICKEEKKDQRKKDNERDTIGGEQEILASFASPVIHPAGNIYIHIYQELLRDELHDQLLWPLVCISETKDEGNFILSVHLYHIFYIMQIWAKRIHSQILPLADLDLAGQGARKFCVGVHGGSLGLLR